MSGDVRPALRPATRADLRRVLRWIPDRDACRRWAGPRAGLCYMVKDLTNVAPAADPD